MSENIFDKILESQGISYDDLNPIEKETYHSKQFQPKKLTLDVVLEYVRGMKDSIAIQLADTPDDTDSLDTNRKLKARLKNYVLFEAFLTAPEKAERAMKRAIEARMPTKLDSK